MHAAPPPAVSTPPSPRYGFRKAQLGMSLADWRASAAWRQAATCSGQPEIRLVCRSPDQPLGKAFRARELTSTFQGGRLASISFTTSVDGFADAMAELRHACGNPTEIKHGRVKLDTGLTMSNVVMTWRNGRSTIHLSDPVAQGGRLRVTMSLDQQARDAA